MHDPNITADDLKMIATQETILFVGGILNGCRLSSNRVEFDTTALSFRGSRYVLVKEHGEFVFHLESEMN